VTEVVVAVIIATLAFAHPPFPEFQSTGPAATVLMLSPIAILPWRRRWPIPVLVLVLAAFGATAALGTLSIGAAIAVGIAMFEISFRSPRSRSIAIGACVAVAIVLLTLPAAVGGIIDPRIFQFGLIVALATAAGSGAQTRIAYITAINDRAERAVQTREAEARRRVSEERLRIARDLHDTVAHQIAVINLSAGAASSAVDSDPARAKESLAAIRSASRSVLAEIGDLLAVLRADDDDAPGTAPQAGLDRLDDLVGQVAASGLDVHTRVEGDLSRVPATVGLVAYRVVQEALTNAHKHGAGERAHILIALDEASITVTVTNPMRADVERPAATGSGLGLIGLRERVASVRGTVEAGPAPGGWRVVARMPLTKEIP